MHIHNTMAYMVRSHKIIQFCCQMFSLTLCLPNAIRCWRIDMRRASKFPKYAEICSFLEAAYNIFLKFRGGG